MNYRDDSDNQSSVANGQLRAFVERIERLEEEKDAIAADIKEIFSEAKGTGYDTKIMKRAIRLRKMPADERQEQEALLELYLAEIGGVA
jgi:uncharacterized protein (UPF0335 family)